MEGGGRINSEYNLSPLKGKKIFVYNLQNAFFNTTVKWRADFMTPDVEVKITSIFSRFSGFKSTYGKVS